MNADTRAELYQEVILEHNRKPRNFRKLDNPTHFAEGYNPICGDHVIIYLRVNDQKTIEEVSFEGSGCAISKASSSMMTTALKGKPLSEGLELFDQFHKLVVGELKPDRDPHSLGPLGIFSGIWQYPSRVKCATLAWHTMKGALEQVKSVTTEE